MSFGEPQQSLQPGKWSSEEPSLPLLITLHVTIHLGTHYQKFGILLLNDRTGIQIDQIENECHGIPEKINIKILQYWLQGRGLPVTWETLLDTLKTCGFHQLVDHIQSSLGTIYCYRIRKFTSYLHF